MKKYFSKLASTMKKENEEIKKKATSVLNNTNGETSDGISQEIKDRIKDLSERTGNSLENMIKTLTSENYTALDIA